MCSPPPIERLVAPQSSHIAERQCEPMDTESPATPAPVSTIPQVDGLADCVNSSDSEDDTNSTNCVRSLSPIPQLDGKVDDKPKDENCGLSVEGRVTRRMSNGPLKVPVQENTFDGSCKALGTTSGTSLENNTNHSHATDQGMMDSRFKVDKEHIEDFEMQFGKAQVVLEPASIPLHDKIAQKIKAESLARSSPSEQGPFRCDKCKRLYRTEESCEKHAETCTFEVHNVQHFTNNRLSISLIIQCMSIVCYHFPNVTTYIFSGQYR